MSNAATGIQQLFVRFGSLIGPIIVGYFFDMSCYLWNIDHFNNIKTDCHLYYNKILRYFLFNIKILNRTRLTILFVAFKIIAICLFFCAYYNLKK